MKNCRVCLHALPLKARFCPNCGAKVESKEQICAYCYTENASGSKFCRQCGKPLGERSIGNDYRILFAGNEEMFNSLKTYFLGALRQRLKEEQQVRDYELYLNVFFEPPFTAFFNKNAQNLVRLLKKIDENVEEGKDEQADHLIMKTFDALLDHFIIAYCNHLNAISLPGDILRYANVHNLQDVDISSMIMDYLDLESEKEPVYMNFLTMPVDKLKNAIKAFVNTQKQESIFFICDQSVLGSCKEGFAMTNKALYWKAHFQKARMVEYKALESVERKSSWLLINGLYFSVNARLNLKMFKLLKKIRSLH